MPESMDYFYFGLCLSIIMSLLPSFYRCCYSSFESGTSSEQQTSTFDVYDLVKDNTLFSLKIISIFQEMSW